MANDFQQVGNIFLGLSEGLQGRGAQFIQQQQAERDRQRLLDAQERERQRKLEADRQKTVFSDSQSALNFAKQGRFDLVSQLGRSRLQMAQNFQGTDFSDTEMLTQMADMAAQGNKEAQENLTKTLQNNVDIGMGLGILEDPTERLKATEVIDGQVVERLPDGSFAAKEITGIKANKREQLELEKLKLQVDKAKNDLQKFTQKPTLELDDKIKIQDKISVILKEPQKIRNSAARLEKVGKTKSPTDQLAAIFTFMKSLDPTSVVREGEQAQARATGGVTDQLLGFVNRIRGEGALPPEVFDDMIETAKSLSNQAVSDTRSEVINFLDTFGDDLPDPFKRKTLSRLPTLFKPKGAQSTSQVLRFDAQGNPI